MKISPIIAALILTASSALAKPPQPEPFGRTPEGVAVDSYTLSNAKGVRLRAITYGAIVVSLETPDRTGKTADIMLGYKTLDEYIKDTPYFGAIVGRYGNRIAGGKFSLAGKTYSLATNNDPAGVKCSLHGGLKGFDKVVWKGEGVEKKGAQGVRFEYVSKDGEEGYPGNLNLKVTYWLTDSSDWEVEYEATSDKATPLNVTQHSYFNLAGGGNVLGHELKVAAKAYIPVDATSIPTGKQVPVAGTAFDFTKRKPIGRDLARLTGKPIGYDHNFVLNSRGQRLAACATVYERTSGRVMEVRTTEPGVQVYTGNWLDGTQCGHSGIYYTQHSGLCLETQHFPDSLHHPRFPSIILRPRQTYTQTTSYKFSKR